MIHLGLVIIGFPSNQFGNQEPGSNSDIKDFVRNMDVTFLMSSKVDVNGPYQHPIFEYVHQFYPTDIEWNFEKVSDCYLMLSFNSCV